MDGLQGDPKWAQPAFGESIWVMAQENGALPSLYLADHVKARPMNLQANTCVATQAGRLFIIDEQGIRIHQFEPSGEQHQPEIKFESPQALHNPHWLPATVLQNGNSTWLIWSSRHSIHLSKLGKDTCDLFNYPLTPIESRLSNLDRHPFLTPAVEKRHQLALWMDGDRVHSFNFTRKQKIEHPTPPMSGTHRAIPLLTDNSEQWLVIGGETGDLDSLGYSITEQSTRESGIVMRVIFDSLQAGTRFAVFTTESGLGTQLMSSLSNSRKINCHIYRRIGVLWREISSFTFKLDTEERNDNHQVNFDMQLDWNGDGFSDLVINDGKKNVRCYLSTVAGGLHEDSKAIGSTADILFQSPTAAIRFDRNGKSWAWQFLKP